MEETKSRNGCVTVLYLTALATACGALLWFAVKGNLSQLWLSFLAAACLAIPCIFAHMFSLVLPPVLEGVAVLFLFSSGMLGEVWNFYEKFDFWDTSLHIVSGFLLAAVGFALLCPSHPADRVRMDKKDSANTVRELRIRAFLAFCFSLSVGTVWEFIEYICDTAFNTDMQKDRVIHILNSDLAGRGREALRDITSVTVNGAALPVSGYIDIGLGDTMKDLAVAAIGAVIFCIWGYLYMTGHANGASVLIPRTAEEKQKDFVDGKTP